MTHIDINSDMGEIAELIANGTQESLMPHITSANIACGGHAGDEASMENTIAQALKWKVAIGAHPGYPDRANFGRLELDMPLEAIEQTVFEQIQALARVAKRHGAEIVHVKPHGALYNQAVKNAALSRAIAAGTARFSRSVVLVGLAGSPMLDVFREAGFTVAAEVFADRRYEADGTLRSRKFPDALIRDPAEAGRHAVELVERGGADTICLHSDTPGAPKIAEAVASALRQAGVEVGPLARVL
jgi:UPF0271 protein